jgi:hypothetical protein
LDIKQQIGPLLAKDYFDQNPIRLKEWFTRFPEAPELLEKEIGEAPIKHALRECMWVSLTFLLAQPNVARKMVQVQTAIDNDHFVCPLIIKSQVQKIPYSQIELLLFLQERVRI